MKVTLKKIKKLRNRTGAGVMACRRALQQAKGDLRKAEQWLAQQGVMKANKRQDRETSEGVIGVYLHSDQKIVGLVEILCETDFVARTKEFQKLAHQLAMQVAAMNPRDSKELLAQAWIRDEEKTIADLVKEMIAKTGENIKVKRIARWRLGEKD